MDDLGVPLFWETSIMSDIDMAWKLLGTSGDPPVFLPRQDSAQKGAAAEDQLVQCYDDTVDGRIPAPVGSCR